LNKNYKIWIIAGETSGDTYGADLARSLLNLIPQNISIAGMGGKAMKEAGVNILVDSTELGVVGFVEVFKHIFKFIRIFKYLVKKAEVTRPDAVILIDYPGFNIRLAKQLFKKNITAIWYISPQVWAWKKNRIKRLAANCKKMLVIFPFEVDVYAESGLPTEFVGHPLVDIVKRLIDPSIRRDPNKFLLLPGSRSSEIERILPIMLETAAILKAKHHELMFKISAARESIKNKINSILKKYIKEHPTCEAKFEIVTGQNIRLLQECGTGLSKSGTINVESAIAGLPEVVFYKLNPITFLIARIVIGKLFRGFFCMVNIIANKTVYEELLQSKATPEALAEAIEKILPGGPRRQEVISEIKYIAENLLTMGKKEASDNVAACVISTVNQVQEKNKEYCR